MQGNKYIQSLNTSDTVAIQFSGVESTLSELAALMQRWDELHQKVNTLRQSFCDNIDGGPEVIFGQFSADLFGHSQQGTMLLGDELPQLQAYLEFMRGTPVGLGSAGLGMAPSPFNARTVLASYAAGNVLGATTAAPNLSLEQFKNLEGLEQDPEYQSLLGKNKELQDLYNGRDGLSNILDGEKRSLAEEQAVLKDYDEVSGNNPGEWIGDFWEHIEKGLNGDRGRLAKSVEERLARIGDLENQISLRNQSITGLENDYSKLTNSIQARVQDVGGGHQVLFPHVMQPKPQAVPGYCMAFAAQWRGDISDNTFGSARDLIWTSDPSVANYRYHVNAQTDIGHTVRSGDLLVYEKSQLTADSDYGHVAVIMKVEGDHVIVKESSWANDVDTWRSVPRSDLNQLTFIGQP